MEFHISSIRRFTRIDWNPERRDQRIQLRRRLLPLLLSALVALLAFLATGNATVRQNLNRSVTQTLSERFLRTVDEYFPPLFQFLSTSSLWTQIGEVGSIGNPASYAVSLHQGLEILGTVSAMSMLDEEGRELVFLLDGEGGFQWFETTADAPNSLVTERNRKNVNYLSLSDVGDFQSTSTDSPVFYRISNPYLLPGSELHGMTIRANIGNQDSGYSLRIWLDLPSQKLAERLKSIERFTDTIVFLLLPGDEFLMFSVQDFIKFASADDGAVIDDISKDLTVDSELLVRILQEADLNEESRYQEAVFDFRGRRWRTDFRSLKIGTQDLKVGTFVPVDTLWVADVFLPVQLAVAAVFGIVSFLVFLILRDFRKNADRLSEEQMLKEFIGQGETQALEFKSSLRWDYRQEKSNKDLEIVIMKSVAAFSNAGGGTLLIGVDDGGHPLGLEPDYGCLKDSGKDYYELHMRSLLIARYGAEIVSRAVKISFPVLEGKEICRLDVEKGRKPLYLAVPVKGGPPTEKFFIRSGNSSRAIDSLSEITSYVVNRFGRKAVE